MKRTELRRRKPMARVAMKKKATKPRKGADPAYLDFVRLQDCASCGHRGPNHAHHKIGDLKGMGLKAPDSEALALCWACHRALHDCRGRFEYMSATERLVFQEYAIEHCRKLWAAEQDTRSGQLGYQLADAGGAGLDGS